MGAVARSVAAKVSKIWNSGRIPVEIDIHLDGSLVSRDHIQRFLHAQPPHLKTFASHDHVFSAYLVVWDFYASWIPRSILRCPRRTVELPVRTGHIPRHIPDNN